VVVENGIIGGVSVLCVLFGFFAFKLRDNDNNFNQMLSLFFFSLSVLFSNLLMGTILLIIQNNSSLSYLENTITLAGYQVLIWTTAVMFVLFVVVMLFMFLKYLYEQVIAAVKRA
jgi:hypothetical protein